MEEAVRAWGDSDRGMFDSLAAQQRANAAEQARPFCYCCHRPCHRYAT